MGRSSGRWPPRLASPAHRVRQLWVALGWAPAPPVDPRDWLDGRLLRLFRGQSRADQRHALRVAHHLLAAGHVDRLLIQAALLHDLGKADAPLRLWDRIGWVLLGRLAPGWRARLAARRPAWRVLADHAAIGAARLAASRADPRLVALVAGQPQPTDRARAALLAAADDAV